AVDRLPNRAGLPVCKANAQSRFPQSPARARQGCRSAASRAGAGRAQLTYGRKSGSTAGFIYQKRDLPARPRACTSGRGFWRIVPMNVTRRRGWEISDRLATPEHLVFSRRNFLAGGVSALAMAPYAAQAQRVSDIAKLPDPSADLYPARRNDKYTLDRPITDEKVNGNYNNFYEYGKSKTVATGAQALPIRPWTGKIDGMVEKPMEVGIDDLIRKLTLEERTYRHRCVEAWGMAIAWTGFPLAKLVEFARPL